MKSFEIDFHLGETLQTAKITPLQEEKQLIYNCVINPNIVFRIRKNGDNKWENLEGNSSALSKLIGWEIDNYIKKKNLKGKNLIGRWDINFNL